MAGNGRTVRVFVDDAVLGRFPPVCALTGRPSDGTMTTRALVGGGGLPGWAWMLVFIGPAGWGILLVWSAFAAPRERLDVELPCTEAAFGQLESLRRRNHRALVAGTAGGAATFAVLFLPVGVATVGIQVLGGLVALATAAALGVAFAAKWQLWRRNPSIELDGSRRWVTIGNVAPAFVSAMTDASMPSATARSSGARGPVDR